MTPALKVDGLCWHPKGNRVLDDVSFELASGQMLGLIGPNGAGKSSLLRCLYRYLRPDSGRISLEGQDISQVSRRDFARSVAVVQQDTPHFFDLSTRAQVAMGLIPHKGWFEQDRAADGERVDAALAQVGLSDKADTPFEQLSGGEKQRALIARAIVQRPGLLLLDEPTNHLDVRYQIQILELVRSLGISVICSIHDLNLASALCDSLLLLERGRTVAWGTPDEVLTEARLAAVFGVCCSVSPHPQHGKPQLQYFYGYRDQGRRN
ncbi:ABC transporter ATP-binding protein [Shewanella cyperi]|uniref:ABC transporter ATP-binding protein n=1 Tax=Shewanella cyperi TaxID=2814292 RepID=A0A974XL91_9GAMM|nr:ABC transporter ATP-binding protein [Shewanella cyperi]QSX29318.1 ABC transporter ATP-binding protein [Shewanella cyperi]